MLRFLFGAALRMLLLAGMIYATFFVPIGEHTLYKHAVRIGGTAEAQELWRAVMAAGEGAVQRATAAAGSRAAAQPPSEPHGGD